MLRLFLWIISWIKALFSWWWKHILPFLSSFSVNKNKSFCLIFFRRNKIRKQIKYNRKYIHTRNTYKKLCLSSIQAVRTLNNSAYLGMKRLHTTTTAAKIKHGIRLKDNINRPKWEPHGFLSQNGRGVNVNDLRIPAFLCCSYTIILKFQIIRIRVIFTV